jgi:hypothetical protein
MSTLMRSHSRAEAGDALLGELIDEVSQKLEAGESVDLEAFIAFTPSVPMP